MCRISSPVQGSSENPHRGWHTFCQGPECHCLKICGAIRSLLRPLSGVVITRATEPRCPKTLFAETDGWPDSPGGPSLGTFPWDSLAPQGLGRLDPLPDSQALLPAALTGQQTFKAARAPRGARYAAGMVPPEGPHTRAGRKEGLGGPQGPPAVPQWAAAAPERALGRQ